MMRDIDFDTLLRQLLLPISDSKPAGDWLRYEPKFAELARLREEDNPNLPMGDWDRPLVKADWQRISDLCVQLLVHESKDFQIAGWLCDAWIRTSQIEGLRFGLAAVHGLVEAYWESAWPAITDTDTDRRIAPFVSMNANLPVSLRLHVVLLPTRLNRNQATTLLDWQDAPVADDAKSGTDTKPSRRDIRMTVTLADSDWLHALSEHTMHSVLILRQLTEALDKQLGKESPSLAKLESELLVLQSAVDNLVQCLPEPKLIPSKNLASNVSAGSNSKIATASGLIDQAATAMQTGLDSNHAYPAEPWQFQLSEAGLPVLHNKEHAYAALEAIAAYLQATNPHDPAPYLVHRAVKLGKMPFPELVQEITASAGSMERFFELLGIDASG
jgi:type VI secretion system protein ImpA